MRRFEFHLDISAQRYLSYYRGTVLQVVVQHNAGIKRLCSFRHRS